ncbi:RdRP-domain-containing protein, partial [Saccharata proteae CBS 121410]
AESLEFGVMHTESSMMVMHKLHPTPEAPIRVHVEKSRRALDIIFPLDIYSTDSNDPECEIFRFRVSLAHMESVYRTDLGEGRVALVIPMQIPPIFWRKTREIDDTHDTSTSNNRVWNEYSAFYRHTDIADNWLALVNDPISLEKLEQPQIDMGRWTTYGLVFNLSNASNQNFQMISTVLAEYNVDTITYKPIDAISRASAEVWNIVDGVDDGKNLVSLDEDTPQVKLSFPVRYQLEVCLSQGCLNEYRITREFLERLAAMDGEDAKALLEKAVDTKRRFYDPMEIFRLNYLHGLSKRAIPEYCTYSRSANVTPSTVYYTTPTVETSNRVIRENSEWADRFLRVKFTDEKNEGNIYFSTDNPKANKQILDRVWRAMDKGICIGDRHYEFLAFGSSQFREHGAYFFASCEERTADQIREVMGDFTHIKEISKYAARLGQCFSTTRALPAEHSEVVKKFIFENDRRAIYTFTDGVGKISRPILQIIGEEFGLPNYLDDPPSLVQFRLGGCKGVLAENPDVVKNAVHIRKSQHKFDAISDGLEICRISQFSSTTLNRQIILCLDALGVPSEVFVRKLREMLRDLDQAMTVESKALDLLQRNIDFNQMTLTVAAMILDGFMEIRDPFMISILQLWRTWNVKHLKDKARLFVKDGAYLLGCTDETKTLRGHFFDEEPYEDASREEKLAALPEIFVQVSDLENPGHYKVITGVCVVARNPSLHPGDIRVVRAVDVEALRHLKNVVVFPQTGDRDIPNMCSGGDLDGDDYMVVWDQDLIPQEINHPAMDFEPTSKAPIPDKVTLKQVKVFFIQYMYNDSLGKIAAAHRRWADWSDEGVKSAQCLELAQLHSKAVDYNKSGVPAKMTKDLMMKTRPHWDFDPKVERNRYYHSNKVLGQLYDQVKQESFKPLYDAQFDSRILNAFELDEKILNKAQELKASYDEAIRRIMAQHGIRSEFEVWSTFVLEHNAEAKEYGFAELIGQVSLALKQRFQAQVYEYAGGKDFKLIAPFVAAMYTVTAREMGAALAESSQPTDGTARNFDPSLPLMSFPWIFQNELGRIAIG